MAAALERKDPEISLSGWQKLVAHLRSLFLEAEAERHQQAQCAMVCCPDCPVRNEVGSLQMPAASRVTTCTKQEGNQVQHDIVSRCWSKLPESDTRWLILD